MKLDLYLLVSLFLVGSITTVLGSDVVEGGETENESDAERMLKRRRRKKASSPVLIEESDETKMYTRSYLTIFGSQIVKNTVEGEEPYKHNLVLGELVSSSTPKQANINKNQGKHFSVIGSVTMQTGPIYNPNDVKFIDCKRQRRKDSCEIDSDCFNVREKAPQYGGGKQPNVVMLKPPKHNYFFNGQCKTVAGFGDSQTLAQSCWYNLCLGGAAGQDCVNIYAGGGYIFDPRTEVLRGEEPLLPPSFPGVVVGGLGKFQGIKGSAQIVTVTTPTSAYADASLVESAPLLVTGYTTQLIQLETTMMLPPSKTLQANN